MRFTMGHTGACWDSALAESFSSALENERAHRTFYATEGQAKRNVIMYIEGSYNNRRPNDVHYAYQQHAISA